MSAETWTEDDKAALLEMFARGMATGAIAQALGRTRDSVRSKLERIRSTGASVPTHQPGRSSMEEQEGRRLVIASNELLARLAAYHARKGNIELAQVIETNWRANHAQREGMGGLAA